MTDIHREAIEALNRLAYRRDYLATNRTMRGVVFAHLGIVGR